MSSFLIRSPNAAEATGGINLRRNRPCRVIAVTVAGYNGGIDSGSRPQSRGMFIDRVADVLLLPTGNVLEL